MASDQVTNFQANKREDFGQTRHLIFADPHLAVEPSSESLIPVSEYNLGKPLSIHSTKYTAIVAPKPLSSKIECPCLPSGQYHSWSRYQNPLTRNGLLLRLTT